MLVTTAIAGCSSKNEPSDSSLSVMNQFPPPARALLPVSTRTPPTATVGSSPPRSKMVASIAVVVVLPCVPATAISRWPWVSRANICPRVTTSSRRSTAAASSGFSVPIADETTTTSAPPTFAAS